MSAGAANGAATGAATGAAIEAARAVIARARRPLLVCGWGSGAAHDSVVGFAAATGWPVLADGISNVRTGARAIAHYEALLRVPGFAAAHRPDVIVRIGGPLTSKTATQWLDAQIAQVLVDPAGEWLDPQRSASLLVPADPADALDALAGAAAPAPAAWSGAWRRADAAASAAIAAAATGEPLAVRTVWEAVPHGTQLLVASSMPVRDLDWFVPARQGVTVHANRGVNGIDGLVSTALGIAVGSGAPTVALLGDLALLHDAGGLLGATRLGGAQCVLAVLDNGGGGIFSFLPQADPVVSPPEEFELLFGTPPGVSVGAVLGAYDVPVTGAEPPGAGAAVRASLAAGGVRAVVVESDRAANVAAHRRLWDAVATAVGSGGPTVPGPA